MPKAFASNSSGHDDAQKILDRLQHGDICQECLNKDVLGTVAKHTLLDRVRSAGAIDSGLRILVYPGEAECSSCKARKRTVYTLAPSRSQHRRGGRAVSTLEQDLRAFLSMLEQHPSEGRSEHITMFGPLFIRTDWELWGKLHRAIHDQVVLEFKYGRGRLTAAPQHLWWAQGSWYLAAHLLRSSADGRTWSVDADGFRSGLNLARINDVRELPEIPFPPLPVDVQAWLGRGDWLFRNDASKNNEAVVLLGSRLLHYVKERLRQGEDDSIELWEFGTRMPAWIAGLLPPTLVSKVRQNPQETFSWYSSVAVGDDPQTRIFVEGDAPAALVRFPYPATAKNGDGLRVGEFEAARKILSWGAEAVVLAPLPLANRVRELVRLAWERAGAE